LVFPTSNEDEGIPNLGVIGYVPTKANTDGLGIPSILEKEQSYMFSHVNKTGKFSKYFKVRSNITDWIDTELVDSAEKNAF